MPTDTTVDLSELPSLDVRTVAIIWGDSDPRPNVIVSDNVDEFQAVGMLRAALKRLERIAAERIDVEGEEDDDEDEDDDDD